MTQHDASHDQTRDEQTEVLATVDATQEFPATEQTEEPLEQTTVIDERVDLEPTTAIDLDTPLFAQFGDDEQSVDADSADDGTGTDAADIADTVVFARGSAPAGEQTAPVRERSGQSSQPGNTENTEDATADSAEVTRESAPAAQTFAQSESANQQIPLYRAAPAPERAPEPKRPEGASAGTIVFGVVVLLFGALTLTVGLLMNTSMFTLVDLNRIAGYMFAAVGILLSVIAIGMGIRGHMRNRRRERETEQR